MSSTILTVGADHIERQIPDAEALLRQYRRDTGCYYLDYKPTTSPDIVVPEDLAVTLLVNSRVTWRAFRSLQLHSAEIPLDLLPQKALEDTSEEERRRVASVIAKMAQLPGFAASVATKVLHKKRPNLIPILDNQAIFGAYMNKDWPQKPARSNSIKSEEWIYSALDWIAFDINRSENASVWGLLKEIEPSRTLIQLFDSVWWMYYKTPEQDCVLKTSQS